jgi:hypothetical protein
MHNTLRVDDTNQSEIKGPFSWKRLAQTKVEQWIQGEAFDLLVASHDGYRRLPQPVTHRRWVVSLKNGLYLVRDVVEGQGRHRLDIPLHLGEDMQLVDGNLFRAKGTSQGLAIVPMRGQDWAEEVRKETWSPAYGQTAPTTVLNFSKTTEMPAEFAFLLVSLDDVQPATRSFTRIGGEAPESAVTAYHYAEEGREYFFFFGTRGKAWRHHAVSSDAEFVCWNRSPGTLDHLLILSNGSYTKISGGPELRCRQPVCWCELVFQGGRKSVRSSNPDAIEDPPDVSTPAQPNSSRVDG